MEELIQELDQAAAQKDRQGGLRLMGREGSHHLKVMRMGCQRAGVAWPEVDGLSAVMATRNAVAMVVAFDTMLPAAPAAGVKLMIDVASDVFYQLPPCWRKQLNGLEIIEAGRELPADWKEVAYA